MDFKKSLWSYFPWMESILFIYFQSLFIIYLFSIILLLHCFWCLVYLWVSRKADICALFGYQREIFSFAWINIMLAVDFLVALLLLICWKFWKFINHCWILPNFSDLLKYWHTFSSLIHWYGEYMDYFSNVKQAI